MTDEKTRTIRRWNDSRIGENPIRFLPPAIILARKHRWLWPYRSRRAALRARQRGQAFAIAVCGHVVAKNQPLVVAGITHDPRFAGSPFLKQHRFRFYAEVSLPAPNAPGIQSGLSLELG
jgi:hypothetical protein